MESILTRIVLFFVQFSQIYSANMILSVNTKNSLNRYYGQSVHVKPIMAHARHGQKILADRIMIRDFIELFSCYAYGQIKSIDHYIPFFSNLLLYTVEYIFRCKKYFFVKQTRYIITRKVCNDQCNSQQFTLVIAYLFII